MTRAFCFSHPALRFSNSTFGWALSMLMSRALEVLPLGTLEMLIRLGLFQELANGPVGFSRIREEVTVPLPGEDYELGVGDALREDIG